MFKRVRWMGLGFVAGVGSSYWVVRKVRATAERYMPPRVADSAKSFGNDVKAALVEGRQAMRDREAELRRQLG